jgi:WD40 repeat protein
VYRLAFSPDGDTLAVGGEKNFRLWDAHTGKERLTFKGHEGGTYAVAFSPNGKVLASGGTWPDCAIRLWDPATGRQIRVLNGVKGAVYSLAFSRDGKTLASAASGPDGTIRLWDVATWDEVRRWPAHPGPVDEFSWTPDDKMFASCSCWERAVRMWVAARGKEINPVVRHLGEVAAASFAPDGQMVATGSWDGTIQLWQTATGKALTRMDGHKGKVQAAVFSPNGDLVASGGDDKTVRLWDIAGKERHRLEGHQYAVTCVAFAPDGKTLASGEGTEEGHFPGGAQLPDGAVMLWDVTAGKPIRRLEAKAGRVQTVAFSPEGNLLATAGLDHATVHLWDPATGQVAGKLKPVPDPIVPRGLAEGIRQMVFSPDGRSVATLSAYRHPSNLSSVKKDDRRDGMTVRLWELATGKERLRLRFDRNTVTSIAFAADGRSLVLGTKDGSLVVRHLFSGATVEKAEAHKDAVTALNFSADGKTLVTASKDTTGLLWDAAAVLARPPSPPAAQTEAQREALWADLGSADAVVAYRAIGALADAPGETLALVRKRVRPVPKVDAGTITRFVQDLGDDQFETRERAMMELERLGELAFPALKKAITVEKGLEARRRIEAMLGKLADVYSRPDAVRALRAVEILELIGGESRPALVELASGEPTARLTREARASLERQAKAR